MNARDGFAAVDALQAVDWQGVEDALGAEGHAIVQRLLSPADCETLAALYADDALFRSRVVMARHGFGRGRIQIPCVPAAAIGGGPARSVVRAARAHREPLAAGDGSRGALSGRAREFIARCHEAGQLRPTPLLLKYGADDYNCLHQDLYGEHAFPLQVVLLLSEPGRDFTGGEFVMTEQRPRMQSRPMVLPLRQGDAAVIAAQHRPVKGTRGTYRVTLRHGVSRVLSGQRQTAGIVFHDAA